MADLVRAALASAAVAVMAFGCSSSADPVAERTAFCAQLAVASSPAGALETLDITSAGSVQTALDELTELHDAAPDVIEREVATIVSTVASVLSAVQESPDRPRAEIFEGLTDELAAADEAADALAGYAESECGLDLRATPTPTPTPAAEAEEEFFD